MAVLPILVDDHLEEVLAFDTIVHIVHDLVLASCLEVDFGIDLDEAAGTAADHIALVVDIDLEVAHHIDVVAVVLHIVVEKAAHYSTAAEVDKMDADLAADIAVDPEDNHSLAVADTVVAETTGYAGLP